jgi:hypothetical protein
MRLYVLTLDLKDVAISMLVRVCEKIESAGTIAALYKL